MVVGDGRNTSFWADFWLSDAPLSVMYPALHSHYTARATSVHDDVCQDLRGAFQARLSAQALDELATLTEQLQGVVLGSSADDRSCFFDDGTHK